MLVDSCSSELICVWVYQYVIPNLLLSQYLSLSLPFSFFCVFHFSKEGQMGRYTKQKGSGKKGLVENNCSFFQTHRGASSGKGGGGADCRSCGSSWGSPHQAWP